MVLASTSGVFTTLVNAPEANATGVNETEVAKSTKSTACNDNSCSIVRNNDQSTILKRPASLNVRSDASTSARNYQRCGEGTIPRSKLLLKNQETSVNGEHNVVQVVIWGLDLWRLCNNRQQQQLFQQTVLAEETAVNKTVKTTAALNVRSSASTSASVVRGD